jgi:sugar transferase (PEP-CTERM/EpsH1 system associated)
LSTIAHVVTGLQIGGLERVAANLVRGFAGNRLLMVCLETGGPLAEEVENVGAKVIVLGKSPGMCWQTIRRMAKLFRQEKVAIVHTHNPPPHFHGVLAARLAGVPVCVHTKHGRNYPHLKRRVWLNRALSWFTDAIVPVSDNAGAVAREIEKVNPRKVRRIWNGVDTDLYQPAVSGQRPAVRPRTIGTVARLSPEKDQPTMLQAFRQVVDQLPAARLVVIGDGPCLPALRDMTAKLNLSGHVEFLGARNDVAALLPGFTVFTLSSVTEGISMTVLEAMACGVPIVATDVGGNREIVQPPACGLIVPARDPQALAAAYLELLRDPAQCARMGAAGRQRVLEHFSLVSMVRQYRALYDELLQRKTG